ncbi:MAG: hypothetical protein ACOCRX_02295 [Candidatus Woesearchaeota archaeon]
MPSSLSNSGDGDEGTLLIDAQMKQQALYNNWDFENIWGIDPNINDGYPYLRVFFD